MPFMQQSVPAAPTRNGIPRGTVSHAARYPTRPGIPRDPVSHAAWGAASNAAAGRAYGSTQLRRSNGIPRLRGADAVTPCRDAMPHAAAWVQRKLTRDHRSAEPAEAARIEAAGGYFRPPALLWPLWHWPAAGTSTRPPATPLWPTRCQPPHRCTAGPVLKRRGARTRTALAGYSRGNLGVLARHSPGTLGASASEAASEEAEPFELCLGFRKTAVRALDWTGTTDPGALTGTSAAVGSSAGSSRAARSATTTSRRRIRSA